MRYRKTMRALGVAIAVGGFGAAALVQTDSDGVASPAMH